MKDNAVAEEMERLAALATPGSWRTSRWSKAESTILCGVNQHVCGPALNADAEMLVALRNNLPTIIAALKAQRVDEGGVS